MNKINFITLGCSKNDVDTSLMKSVLNKDKFTVTNDVREADIIIVNTCGFINDAKEESIETILEAAKFKDDEFGKCEKLILAGCLAQRYPEDLLEAMPEVDGILGTGNISDINLFLENILENNKVIKADNINDTYLEGYKKAKENILKTEYVKISEGCNNNCTYCIIPKLRGRNRSRNIENIVEEVKYLTDNGTEEIILIAQNTTDYGIDNYKDYKLHELIKEISLITKVKWIRVMYLYPDHFTDDLIEEFKTNEKLVKYVDIPLQHISNNVLSKMNRRTNKEDVANLLNKLRESIENIVIRTTFIVGFPGETDEDFDELISFITENPIDKVGAFKYSREEDTLAFSMDEQIDEEIKEDRLNSLMEEQQIISEKLLSKHVNTEIDVLIEEKASEDTFVGRGFMDAPEIDGVVYIKSNDDLKIGDFVKVRIQEALEYDLIGEII